MVTRIRFASMANSLLYSMSAVGDSRKLAW